MRLNQSFGEIPKLLLEVGGKTLLEWHLRRLLEAGVNRLALVTGYRRELIAQTVALLRGRYPIQIDLLVNDEFRQGSVLSFYASLPLLRKVTSGSVLLMDGDVLYPPSFLPRLLGSVHRTALLVDRDYSTADDDPVLVPMRSGRPFDFIKKWTGEAEQIGESVGFFKVAAEDLDLLNAETARRSEGAGRGDSYDDVLRVLVREGRFGAEDITGQPWTEIDFPGDVTRARNEVLPSILDLESGSAAAGDSL